MKNLIKFLIVLLAFQVNAQTPFPSGARFPNAPEKSLSEIKGFPTFDANNILNGWVDKSDLEVDLSNYPTKTEVSDEISDSISGLKSSLYIEKFIYNTSNLNKEFELDFEPTQIERVTITNSDIFEDESGYEITGTKTLKILSSLKNDDVIRIWYWHGENNTTSYSKAESDGLFYLKTDGENLENIVLNIADGTGGKSYPSLVIAMSVVPLPEDNTIFTIDASNVTEAGIYAYDSTQSSGCRFVNLLNGFGEIEENNNGTVTGGKVYKSLYPLREISNVVVSNQLFDKTTALIESGEIFPSGLIASNNALRLKVNLTVGQTYSITRFSAVPVNRIPVIYMNASNVVIGTEPRVAGSINTTFTVPVGTVTTYIHLGYLAGVNALPLRDNALVNNFMMNFGATPLPYEDFGREDVSINTNKIEKYEDVLDLVEKEILVELPKKNLLDKSLIDFTKRYSPGSSNIVNNTSTVYVLTPRIQVKFGEWYAWNGHNSGGYFTHPTDGTTAIANISWITPVDGQGFAFQVPEEYDGYYVVLNAERIGTSGTTLAKEFQLEVGEQTTTPEPFELVEQFNPQYLIEQENSGSTPSNSDLLTKLTDINSVTKLKHNYLLNFFKHHRLKDKDLVVANTGTSLTARSIEHCTEHPKASERPPMMHSMNMLTYIWDEMKWDSQLYRRYDFAGFFSESGTWATSSNLSNWDDGAYRSGLTRYSDHNASTVEFTIPVNAWQYNFIFRTDDLGTENAVITIASGNGKVEVFDESDSTWKEANGFMFSQKQVVQNLTNVTVPDARVGTSTLVPTYQIGGNTTYQKRLKMRCKSGVIDSRAETKNVTISRTSGRLMYWGVEWSVREFMITLINAARGSHSMTMVGTGQDRSLTHFQENEVWGFKPDLMLTENPIHNSGAGNSPTTTYPTNYWGQVTEDFFFGANPVSLKSRATANSLNPEWMIFTTSIAWNFGGINDDGSLKVTTDKNGKFYTALESFSKAHQHLLDNHPEVLAINSVNYWVKSGFDAHGNLRIATEGSGKSGNTFTNEGSHWNNTGSKIIAKTLLSYLNFEQ